MHQPRPYGLYGQLHGEEDVAAVDALVRRLTNLKHAGSLASIKLVRDLPSGGVAIALDMGGVLKVIVRRQEEEQPLDTAHDGIAKADIPMLFSGVITRPFFQSGSGVEMNLTAQACRRLANYAKDGAGGVSPRQSLQRFAIEYAPRHSEFIPDQPGAFTHSQYVNLRATWFSGRMATLVQVAGGYGRQDFDALPDSQVERAKLKLPEKVREKVERQLGNQRLPGYTGLPPESGQIQFDYKFFETHAVSFGSPGKPWLVRINQSGVYAMPLPMVPATTTTAFREYMEQVGDEEITWLLDRFGGMPSGEGFPVGATAFEAWRRAGVISKVCDVGDFFQNSMYSSACGWCANTSGTQLVNTCWEFGDDGIQVGKTFMMSLRMGTATNDGRLPHGFELSDPLQQAQLNAYLAAIYEAIPKNQSGLAIKYKMRRVPVADILARARGGATGVNAQAEVSHWDSLEMSPIASHSGSVSLIARGKLWAPGRPRSHPQIKYAEPLMEGCVSHDFGRLEGSPSPSPAPLCDTIMYAYYVGDDLKVVKYFRDDRSYFREVEDNYEDCMIVGAWERTITEGSTSLLGHFYLSDLDERKAAAPVTTVIKTVGTDLGYEHPPQFAFDHFFSMVGTIWRNRYFQHKVNTEKTEGYGMSLAVCMPYLDRSAALHAKTEAWAGETSSESVRPYKVGDPNTYRYYTRDFVWAWVGGSTYGNMAHIKDVSPWPIHGNPVWVVGYNYAPYPCSDFADSGDWMGGLPRDYTWLIHPNKNEWRHSGGGNPPKVKSYNISTTKPSKTEGELVISIQESIQHVNNDPSRGYFTMSPDDGGGVFYVDAIRNVSGETVYASFSEFDVQGDRRRKRWGYSRLADHKSAHHFIGVVNE